MSSGKLKQIHRRVKALSEYREQPSLDREQPSINREQPSLDREQPSINWEQPSLDREQPSINREQPNVIQFEKYKDIRYVVNSSVKRDSEMYEKQLI